MGHRTSWMKDQCNIGPMGCRASRMDVGPMEHTSRTKRMKDQWDVRPARPQSLYLLTWLIIKSTVPFAVLSTKRGVLMPPLRSSCQLKLLAPPCKTSNNFSERAFTVADLQHWNQTSYLVTLDVTKHNAVLNGIWNLSYPSRLFISNCATS